MVFGVIAKKIVAISAKKQGIIIDKLDKICYNLVTVF